MNDKERCWPCEEDVIEKLPPCPLQCRSDKCKSFKRVSLEGIPIVWVLGGPGSGKGTLCGKIIGKYQFTPLLPGALVQAEVKTKSVRGKCLSKILERNDTAPSDVIIDLMKDAIYKAAAAGSTKGFLFDGFPKDKSQAVMFEKRIRPCTVIFYLEATSDTLTKRLMKSQPNANEQAVKQRVKATFESDELLLAAFCDKAYRDVQKFTDRKYFCCEYSSNDIPGAACNRSKHFRDRFYTTNINAENDADVIFRELSEILDSFIPEKTDKVLPK